MLGPKQCNSSNMRPYWPPCWWYATCTPKCWSTNVFLYMCYCYSFWNPFYHLINQIRRNYGFFWVCVVKINLHAFCSLENYYYFVSSLLCLLLFVSYFDSFVSARRDDLWEKHQHLKRKRKKRKINCAHRPKVVALLFRAVYKLEFGEKYVKYKL